MSTNTLQCNKHQKILHCSQNKIIIEGRLFCWKCKAENNKFTKQFNNCKSLYYHLISLHSGTDKETKSTRNNCIERLQNISNEIQLGVLK